MANIRTFNNNVSVLVVSFSVENTEVWAYRKVNFINFFLLQSNFCYYFTFYYVYWKNILQGMWTSSDKLAVVGS